MIIDIHCCHPFGNSGYGVVDRIKVRRDAVLLRRRDPKMFEQTWLTLNDETSGLIEDMKEAVELIERTRISDSDREKIYHLNAERWLKL